MLREDSLSLASRGPPHPCGPGCKCGALAASAQANIESNCVMCRSAGPGRPGPCCPAPNFAPPAQPFSSFPPDIWQAGAMAMAASELASFSQSGPPSVAQSSLGACAGPGPGSLASPPPASSSSSAGRVKLERRDREASRERQQPAAHSSDSAAGGGGAQPASAMNASSAQAQAAQASLGLANGSLTAEQLHAREAKLGALRTIGKHLLAGARANLKHLIVNTIRF